MPPGFRRTPASQVKQISFALKVDLDRQSFCLVRVTWRIAPSVLKFKDDLSNLILLSPNAVRGLLRRLRISK